MSQVSRFKRHSTGTAGNEQRSQCKELEVDPETLCEYDPGLELWPSSNIDPQHAGAPAIHRESVSNPS
jgi:hypothetical protein